MNRRRDLLDVDNVGEFAFAMCAMGLLLAVIAYVAAFFVLEWAHWRKPWHLGTLSAAFWMLLNIPVYRALRRRARRWVGEQRATKQIVYVEVCSMSLLIGLSWLAGDAIGGREVVVVLKYLFSFWILALLAYQVLVHSLLRYRIFLRDAVRWCVLCSLTFLNLYASNS